MVTAGTVEAQASTTRRAADLARLERAFWARADFPGRDAVEVEGARWAHALGSPVDLASSRHARGHLTIGPGVIALSFCDIDRRARSEERGRLWLRSTSRTAGYVQGDDYTGHKDAGERSLLLAASKGAGAEVSEWSRKSRSRMLRTFAGLDLAPLLDGPGTLGMATVTAPADWLSVFPNGAAFKAAVIRFRKRYFRRFGTPLIGLWKLEFQRRGAPHLHIAMRIPAIAPAVPATRRAKALPAEPFETWFSRAWADSVNHPDPVEYAKHLAAGTAVDFGKSVSMRDPRSLALYFLKHSAKTGDGKEYQHIVPAEWQGAGDGPGRFWGSWGLSRSEVTVELAAGDALELRRAMRRLAESRARARSGKGTSSRLTRRYMVRSLRQSGMTGGWFLDADAPATAACLRRWVLGLPTPHPPPPPLARP